MRFMQALFEQEGSRRGQPTFTVRHLVLGHLQQGNQPTPLDRVRAARLATVAVDWMMQMFAGNPSGAEEMPNFNGKDSVVVVRLARCAKHVLACRCVGQWQPKLRAGNMHALPVLFAPVSQVGVGGAETKCTPVDDLISETDFVLRRPKRQWWARLKPLIRTLALDNHAADDSSENNSVYQVSRRCASCKLCWPALRSHALRHLAARIPKAEPGSYPPARARPQAESILVPDEEI